MKRLDWILVFVALAISIGAVWWTLDSRIWPTQLRTDINDLEKRVEILEAP